jgi:hypothetical protein
MFYYGSLTGYNEELGAELLHLEVCRHGRGKSKGKPKWL